jgi:hypothetical protein
MGGFTLWPKSRNDLIDVRTCRADFAASDFAQDAVFRSAGGFFANIDAIPTIIGA